MVLVFYLLCIVSMMMIRPCLNKIFLKKGKSAIYCSLYFIPVLSIFHTVAGGLICKFNQNRRHIISEHSFVLPFFLYRLLVSVSECDNLDDLQCCPLFPETRSKYEIVDFIVGEGNEKYCRHKYMPFVLTCRQKESYNFFFLIFQLVTGCF